MLHVASNITCYGIKLALPLAYSESVAVTLEVNLMKEAGYSYIIVVIQFLLLN